MVHDHDVLADRDPTVMLGPGDAEPTWCPTSWTRRPARSSTASGSSADDRSSPSPTLTDGDGDATRPAKRHRVPHRWSLALLLVVALAGAGAYWYTEIRVPTFAVPTLVGTNTAALDATISGTGWDVQTTTPVPGPTVPGRHPGPGPGAGPNWPAATAC